VNHLPYYSRVIKARMNLFFCTVGLLLFSAFFSSQLLVAPLFVLVRNSSNLDRLRSLKLGTAARKQK